MPTNLLSLDAALERIYGLTPDLGVEEIPVSAALGRYPAQAITAKLTQPPFNASAMDGYALKSTDAVAGKSLSLVGTAQAGTGFGGAVAQGECVRIFTGAPLPGDCDCVIIQENVTANGATITLNASGQSGDNIRAAGQDFKEDQLLLSPGKPLNAIGVGLAATSNNGTVAVARRPRIAIVATGDELVLPGSELKPGQIVTSNSIALASLLEPFAERIDDLGIIPDDEELMRKTLSSALNGDYDMLITSGGASVGDHDLVQPVLKSLGVEMDFWKIAIRPGKPLMAGKKSNTLVMGLPGNPVSALVTAHVAVLPAIRHMMGATNPAGDFLQLPLDAPLPANGPRRHFWRARLVSANSGTRAAPVLQTDSAHLSSLATSQVLIIHPENAPARDSGDIVACLPLTPFF